MKKTAVFALLSALACSAQMVVPEGTKLRVRLEQNISSATAEEGQTVELTVTDGVNVGDTAVIAEGARVTGTITQAHEKRRMGRAGSLDFSIDRVKTVDDQWVPLRYTVTKKSGQSHALATGILTAGTAAVFWPAAPVMLLRKGNDVTINRGVSFDVYTDTNHTMTSKAAPPVAPTAVAAAHAPVATVAAARPAAPAAAPSAAPQSGSATISITSSSPSADIEVDGAFVGNTPTSLQLPSGQHRFVVKQGAKSWQRTMQVNAGSTITLNAVLQ
jgi:hypothetical protein